MPTYLWMQLFSQHRLAECMFYIGKLKNWIFDSATPRFLVVRCTIFFSMDVKNAFELTKQFTIILPNS